MLFPGWTDPKAAMARFAARAVTLAPALVALAIACPLPAPGAGMAWAQEGERPFGLIDRLFGGSERIGGSERAPAVAGERTAQMPGADLLLRLERLEAHVRQLTGHIEQLQHRNQQLETLVRRLSEDSESRFLEPGGKTRPLAQPRGAPPAPASAAPARRGDAFDPTQHPNAPGAPQPLGSIPAGTVAAAGDGAAAAGSRAAAPGTLAALPPAAAGTREEYDAAYGHVLRKDYAQAEASFRNFLARHPADRLAGDATYWYGESLYQRQRFRDAAEAFLNVSTKFESNAKAPEALLRLGQSLAALDEKEAACASLAEVLRKYPRAPASVRQGVEREQKRVRC
jgi:tol-pal system protein YbgF